MVVGAINYGDKAGIIIPARPFELSVEIAVGFGIGMTMPKPTQ